MPQQNRPVRAPVQPRVPPRVEHNPQTPLHYQTPPRQRPWHQKVRRFLDQMNRDFVHTRLAAVLSLIVAILFFLLLNPFTRRAIILLFLREQ